MSEYHDTRKTEERLRSWLNTNQSMREQMCLELLKILGPFSNCQPRRPKGGPDGARDIEAVYDNSIEVWAAVGFKNDASSSDEHRKWAEGKFKTDLDSALEENPRLEGFVFLTNVDLTPAIKDSLKQHAIAKGLKFVEVYDFELLRHHLDSPEGLIVRHQHLGLLMTPTEQVAFLNRYGPQIQDTIVRGFSSVERTLQRIEFLTECQLPVREVDIELSLNTHVTVQEIPDAACILRIDPKYQGQDLLVCLCQTDSKYPTKNLATVSYLWTSSAPSQLSKCGHNIFGSPAYHFSGSFHVKLNRGLIPISFGDFISGNMAVYCTPCLRKYVMHLKAVINGFVVFDIPAPTEDHYLLRYGLEWPDQAPKELVGRDWITLTRSPWPVDISRDTLRKSH